MNWLPPTQMTFTNEAVRDAASRVSPLAIREGTTMDNAERKTLETLDAAVLSVAMRARIDEIIVRVAQALDQQPDEPLAWEPIPLEFYSSPLPPEIRSSWVFILRADTNTGAERHPNSHQRMMSYRGSGDFQTMEQDTWKSNLLTDDPSASLEQRWISIPPNVWHRGVVPEDNWVVVSFHTVPDKELIEERPETEGAATTRRRKYVD